MSTAQATADTSDARSRDWVSFFGQFGALIVLAVICVIFAVLEPAFISQRNIFNVLRQVSIYGVLAVGMTFVILTGGIDLSIGSMLAFAGLVAASVEKGGRGLLTVGAAGEAAGYGVPAAIAAALGVGLLGGLLQGLGVSKMKVPPFVVTLGGMSVFRGLTLLWSGGQPISAFRDQYKVIGQGFVGPVPIPVIIFALFAIVGVIVLRMTRYGRHIYAVGGNQEAARLSGLNTTALLTSVYVISGFCCGAAGFILSSRLNSAEQVAGDRLRADRHRSRRHRRHQPLRRRGQRAGHCDRRAAHRRVVQRADAAQRQPVLPADRRRTDHRLRRLHRPDGQAPPEMTVADAEASVTR